MDLMQESISFMRCRAGIGRPDLKKVGEEKRARSSRRLASSVSSPKAKYFRLSSAETEGRSAGFGASIALSRRRSFSGST